MNLDSLERATEKLTKLPRPEQTKMNGMEESKQEGINKVAANETSVDADTEKLWIATHRIGTIEVQEKYFLNGFPYWMDKSGKRRRPTQKAPLKPIVSIAKPARELLIDREAFAICTSVLLDHTESFETLKYIARRLDANNVLLTVKHDSEMCHENYVIQVPPEFQVVGREL